MLGDYCAQPQQYRQTRARQKHATIEYNVPFFQLILNLYRPMACYSVVTSESLREFISMKSIIQNRKSIQTYCPITQRKSFSFVDPSVCNDLPFKLRSLLMVYSSKL